MAELFKIAEFSPLGDSDTGETYTVKLSHDCLGKEVVLKTGFGRECKGIITVECKECHGIVVLAKDISSKKIISICDQTQSDS